MKETLQDIIETLRCFDNPIMEKQAGRLVEVRDYLYNNTTGINGTISYYAEKHQVPIADILNGPRTNKLVLVRAEIAKEAKERGFGPSEIGRAINKDHSTIIHYLEDYHPPTGYGNTV